MDDLNFQERYKIYLQAIEEYLSNCFTEETPWNDLYNAMRYSLLAGGKRIRPALTLEFARLTARNMAKNAQDNNWRRAVPIACALELVHTYSLIHDDLPCMDNDDLRRGRLTSHKKFGETMAILAGDALQAEAYRMILSAADVDAENRAECALILAKASGADGMVAGQVLDTLREPGREPEYKPGYKPGREPGGTLEDLALTHRLKTGAMIAGACELGVAAVNNNKNLRETARQYGYALGMAFQIRDDLLDVIGDTQEFGKPVGSDRESGKFTFVDALGIEGCEREIEFYTNQAADAARNLDDDCFLIDLARNLAGRVK